MKKQGETDLKERDFEVSSEQSVAETIRRLERENLKLRKQLEDSQSTGAVGSWTLEISTGNVTWTEELFKIFKIEPADAAPAFHTQADLYSAGSWELLCNAVDSAIKHGERFEIVLRIIRADKSEGWILSKCSPISDHSGQVERLHGSAVDISSSKEFESKNEQLTKITNLAIESSKIGVWTLNTKTKEYNWNDNLLEIFGITPDVFQANPNIWKSMVHPEDRVNAEVEFSKIDTGYAMKGFKFRVKRNDGEVRYLECSGMQHVENELTYNLGVMLDVTDSTLATIKLLEHEEELTQSIISTVEMAGQIASQKDPYTGLHELNVANICVAIAEEMQLPGMVVQGIEIGAKLHDLGKISIPMEILTKPGRLNDLEFELIKTHSQAGYEALKGISFPWPIAAIALQHHERLDGSGYPAGLKGEEIILEARIVAVADVVESMCNRRPYRPALGIEKAVEEISSGAGKLYDPEVVAACLRAISAQKISFIEN